MRGSSNQQLRSPTQHHVTWGVNGEPTAWQGANQRHTVPAYEAAIGRLRGTAHIAGWSAVANLKGTEIRWIRGLGQHKGTWKHQAGAMTGGYPSKQVLGSHAGTTVLRIASAGRTCCYALAVGALERFHSQTHTDTHRHKPTLTATHTHIHAHSHTAGSIHQDESDMSVLQTAQQSRTGEDRRVEGRQN